MRDFRGLPVITSPNLPKGTALLVNPDFAVPHFEIGPISGPYIAEGDIHFKWRPMATVSTTHGWEMASIYGMDTAHDDMLDALRFAFMWVEPVKYRGLARVVHALRRLWRRFR
jgi:hypothetical protein